MKYLKSCPVCSSTKLKRELTKDDLDKKYTFSRCQNCSLLFVNPLPDINELNEYYNEEYYVPLHQQRKVIKKGRKILFLANTLGLPKKAKVFELGASHGFFLNEARSKGHEILGVELSKKATKHAKDEFNIELENELFEKSKAIKKKEHFDLVTMFDVIEHLSNPKKAIEDLAKINKKGGLIALTTPNINSLEYKFYGRRWEWLSPPAHLFYYNAKSMRILLEEAGYEIVHLETYRGDSAGNFMFHSYLALRQSIFYSLKYIMGKKKLIEKRQSIRNNIKKDIRKNYSEFAGLSLFVYKFTEILGNLFTPLGNRRNRKGKGATLLVIARKK